ncbi:uncharacterized protein PV07_02732 [Cladophialophora immunda]|uniref:ATP-dependent RNA helicase n=1 Tax=Cladophialophora immunda TaxID=569365 RepID=A0A0D2D5V8_9EURO|nr:uncharacterized protein PV07_02732 [Cladophialophora immunda]KIW31049.1 hypothetical protein PV07_02732 [Cladophialophora immunda]OQV05921.1 Helicase conserved domain-containing protein [Cladophialophora immunda]
MSGFYSRYVPSTTKTDGLADITEKPKSSGDKRKRDRDAPIQEKRRKKLKTSKTPDRPIDTSPLPVAKTAAVTAEDSSFVTGKGILDKYRVTEAAGSETPSVTVKSKTSNALQHENSDLGDGNQRERDNMTKKKRKKEKRGTTGEQEEEGQVAAHAQKHTALLTKYAKVRQQDQVETMIDTASDEPPAELHGLEPIPQPEQIDVVSEKPNYSILPPWQENPLIVPLDSTSTFGSLGIREPLLDNLRRLGLRHALPIQASVLPLILDGPSHHSGDLCVSAATGSGKTLSYVLPIVADLKDIPGTKLRAVIVVPTRELVKQVRDLCDACAAGTSIKFATAVGSKSLTEERDLLMKEEKIYDPEEYERWQQRPIDWADFSLSRLAQNAKDTDPMEAMGYVTRYRSKVDVLITTPGRLVDHLKSTLGFTLDDVKWLVVDEADRLLNESYQEWIAAVKPALESRTATSGRDQILRHMRMALPRRNVTKMLLSATMTRDLSKLNSLGLWNPKLIVLGGTQENARAAGVDVLPERLDEQPQKDSEVVYLPETLKEAVVPVTNGAEKPLYLLELLHSHIALPPTSLKPDHSIGRSSLEPDVESESTSSSESSSESLTSSEDERGSATDAQSGSRGRLTATSLAAKKVSESQGTTAGPRALVFTRSTASATRLCRLLCIIDPLFASRISTLTRSTASSASSRRALASFRRSKISILIATDRASRGLDVPGLEHVVSYDVPNSPLTYVHRVGRTARAGRVGHAWTFVEHREAAWFWREIGGKAKHTMSGTGNDGVSINRQTKISKLNLSVEGVDLRKRYEAALQQLEKEVLGK